MDLHGKIALVSGASRGIGYYMALELAKAGAHIVATARTISGLEALDDAIKAMGGSATLVPFDLGDMAAIDALGASLFERWGTLDILVANAGILGTISPIGHIDAHIFDQVMMINVTATWRLIRSVEPLLKTSDCGRALVLSSGAAHSCRAFWSAYAASKAAVEALVRCWAAEQKDSQIRINAVDPGATRTAMRAMAVPGEDPQTLPHPEEVARAMMALCAPTLKETGQLFSVPQGRFLTFHRPD